jgi:M-phase inducer tyrosine phosphatase
MITRDVRESPSAKFIGGGMPGFGDNEALGKILPCHRVTEDGLMRINPQTLDKLLDGVYDSRITKFYVIDCRFDYEYNGGHIPGAVNINTTPAVEEFLLGAGLSKPKPSTSGDPAKKTVLIFHCEFSAKRAPTFAKYLRAKDRAMNNHVYPRIHYPEVYILEGGYCQYFKSSAKRCQPSAYVTMDDPLHSMSRREDLDQFRKAKFGRHKSYAYGEGPFKAVPSQQQQKRNTAPSGGPNPLFAAANAARTRRGGNLMTLVEDGNTTAHSDDDDTDIGDSPCPPPTKTTAFKAKKMGGRPPLIRAETYGPARMVY